MTVGWENQTWFRANETISMAELTCGLNRFDSKFEPSEDTREVTLSDLEGWFGEINDAMWNAWGLPDYSTTRALTRKECAVVIDALMRPFYTYSVTLQGEFIR